ncbi:MAG: threonine synthase [Firmicutes bacterium]|nr:threonine synthase [Bacillota bacterium]
MPTLTCVSCGKTYPLATGLRCSCCNEPLEIRYESLKPPARIKDEPCFITRNANIFPWSDLRPELSLGEGATPLLEAPNLQQETGLNFLYLKNETANPTWSFKDRGTALGVQAAVRFGLRAIGTVSSGNMAASIAAYAARAGLAAYIFVQENMPAVKIEPIAIYNPCLYRGIGDYGQLYFNALRWGEKHGIYFISSDNPFRVEGQKTVAFEILDQLNYQQLDYIIMPVSSGGNMAGVIKAVEEMEKMGLIKTAPQVIGVQAEGCCPIYKAAAEGKDQIEHFGQPNTIARAISNPIPPSGNRILRKVQQGRARIVAVSEKEILAAQSFLAHQEGLFVQPAGAVPVAAIRKLAREGSLKPSDKIAAILTGSGLKDTSVLAQHRLKFNQVPVDKLEQALC